MSRGFESLTCAKTLPGSIDSRSHCSNNIPARTASWENVAAAVGAKRSCWKYLLGQRLSERWPWLLGAYVILAFSRNRRIALTHESLLVPKPTFFHLASQEIEIPFAEISSIAVRQFAGRAKSLQINYT